MGSTRAEILKVFGEPGFPPRTWKANEERLGYPKIGLLFILLDGKVCQITVDLRQAFREAFVGEEEFRNGVRAYLRAHLYGNARTEDLWRAVQTSSGAPLVEVARSFTGQSGVPLSTSRPCGATTYR